MKVIVINRKRVKITTIIIGLMIILFSAEKIFDGKLKFVALVNSNLDELKQYSALQDKFTYKLPEDWETKETDFSSKDIIYHNDFNSKDQKIYGFVQVWKSQEDLKVFLDKSKEVSSKQNKISNYDLQPIEINDNKGYVVHYSMKTPQNASYMANEFFIDDGDSFIRFSFFVSEKNYKENMLSIFKGLVSTFKYEK
ncbi:hypothetical protein [Clostridium amazonitimonense]|uniref:hypothetical protein n=1 Tax=Clostridium amazonitimonense TaxID=1499689 RepID=UPI0005094970|nr:hypothetical protein [Clostridium amazonitimonense]